MREQTWRYLRCSKLLCILLPWKYCIPFSAEFYQSPFQTDTVTQGKTAHKEHGILVSSIILSWHHVLTGTQKHRVGASPGSRQQHPNWSHSSETQFEREQLHKMMSNIQWRSKPFKGTPLAFKRCTALRSCPSRSGNYRSYLFLNRAQIINISSFVSEQGMQ